MKRWYAVITTFDNRGKVTANIVDQKESENQPDSTFTETTRKDIYVDWYGSLEEAQKAVKDAMLA